MKDFGFTQDGVTGPSTRTPEVNLWWSVLAQLTADLRLAINAVSKDLRKKGAASISSHTELQHLLRIAHAPWCGEMCSFVDIHHDTFIRGCARLIEEAGLATYPVEEKDKNFTFRGTQADRMRGL